MATVPHVTSGLGLRKFQTDGFLLTRVYMACLVLHFEAFAAVTKNLAGLYFPLMGSYPYTGCFTTSGHNCWRWFPRPLWWKSSYKHVSDFGRLGSYDRFLIPVHALVWTASEQLAGSWTPLQTVQFPLSRHLGGMRGRWGWVGNVRSSQPSGSLCCGRRWHFRKPALSTDKFKLKVISRS